MKWLLNELKTNAVRYAIDLILALVILFYTLHRIDRQYDNLEQKVNQTYDLVAGIIQAQGAYLDTVSGNIADASTTAVNDLKQNRKQIYKGLYDRLIKKDSVGE